MRPRLRSEAIKELYEHAFERFVAVASVVVGDAEDGRDIVQDAFAKALDRSSTFRGEGPLEAWVWTIVLNRAREQARRRRPYASELERRAAASMAAVLKGTT